MSKVEPKHLGDLITLKRGYDLPEKKRKPGPYPVISSAGISGWHNEYKVEGPGVVTGRYGTLGEVYYAEDRYWPHNTALYVQNFKGNDPKYIYYLLSCLGRIRTSDKSAVPGVNRNELHEMSVPTIDDLTAQVKTRELLEVIDLKIDINNRISTELEAMAKTLYNYWFVQFDFPDTNGKPYKSSGGKMVYNSVLKRDIPRSWRNAVLGDFITLERGVTYGKGDVRTEDDNDTIGVLRATNVKGNIVDIDDLVFIPSMTARKSQTLKKFDTLIVMSSGSKEHVGKNGIYYFDNHHAFGAFCSKITPSNGCIFFVNTFLQSTWFKSYIRNQCLGTNINNLTNKHISMCEIISPESSILASFEKKLANFYEKIALNTQENRQLDKLRDWLLPMLMNRQVTVR